MIQPVQSKGYKRKLTLPSIVFQCVNKQIEKNYDAWRIQIYQGDLIRDIASLEDTEGMDVQMASIWPDLSNDARISYIFDEKWLNFEDYYRDAGWVVSYEKPCMGETFKSHWIFRHG